MKSTLNTPRATIACVLLCALLSGCMHRSAPSIPENVSSGEYRQRMIQWHQQHDKRPAVPAPGQ